jgi:hypothetical protein
MYAMTVVYRWAAGQKGYLDGWSNHTPHPLTRGRKISRWLRRFGLLTFHHQLTVKKLVPYCLGLLGFSGDECCVIEIGIWTRISWDLCVNFVAIMISVHFILSAAAFYIIIGYQAHN